MASESARAQIEAMTRTLNEAKSYSGLGPDDPAVVELEQIIQTKIAEIAASMAAESAPGESATVANEPTVATSAAYKQP